MGQTGAGQGEQRQYEQDSHDQLDARAVAVVMDLRSGLTAGWAATLRYRPGTVGTD
jgi:hypothetical protein